MPGCCWAAPWPQRGSRFAWSSASRSQSIPRPGRTGAPWPCSPAASRSCAASGPGRSLAPHDRSRSSGSRWSTSSGGGQVHYDSDAHGSAPFGAGVEHTDLRRGLLRAFLSHAGEAAVLARRGGRHAPRRACHVLTAGLWPGDRARLVVGADGRGSRVRELAGIGVDRWSYDQQALTMVLRHERPHRGTVREWLRRGGPLATLPLPRTAHRDHLGRACGRGRGSWPRAAGRSAGDLRRRPPAACWGSSRSTAARPPTRSAPSTRGSYVAPRVALVGDAAHGVHPIHAQGFNMGVADVGALVDSLVQRKARGLDLGSGRGAAALTRAPAAATTPSACG